MNWEITELTDQGNNFFLARYKCSEGENKLMGDIQIKTEIPFKDLTEEKVLELVKEEICNNLDGSKNPNNLKNIEDTVALMKPIIKTLPWE